MEVEEVVEAEREREREREEWGMRGVEGKTKEG